MVRPKTYHDRTSTSLSFERQMLNEFLELCRTERKTVSEKITEMIQQELEKNAVGRPNPAKIQYRPHAINISKPGITIPLDDFIDTDRAKSLANTDNHHLAYANTRKVFQQLQLKTTGKITV